MSASILIDGRAASALDVRDRATQYGDGVFETLAVRDGRARFVDHHLDRLQHGCQRLGMPVPDADTARAELDRLTAGQARAVLKLIVTRGRGGRGYRAPKIAQPRRIVLRYPWPGNLRESATRGLRLMVCATRLAAPSALAGIKHLNRLEQILARNEWDADTGVDEGLMLDADENVIEATAANLFIVRDGALLTPALTRCGVAGVMRRVVCESAASLDIPCTRATISLADVESADEVFLTNALLGVAPVTRLGARRWPHGQLTTRLATAVAALES